MTDNLDLWNELALIHSSSPYYNIEFTLNGGSTLMQIEKELLGDITKKRILHLHCHLGQDTISLARTAQYVAGVDFSPKAIEIAKKLADNCKQKNLDFIVQDVQQLSEADLKNIKFDIAIATYGVLMWVKDLEAWFQSIAKQLKNGGRLIIVEEHPFAAVFSGKKDSDSLIFEAPYSCKSDPYITTNQYSYADTDNAQILTNDKQYKWSHGISKIFKAFRTASLTLESFDEYYQCFYNILPNMEKYKDGYWRLKEKSAHLPLLFSIVLVKNI